MRRTVTADLTLDISDEADVELQIAVADRSLITAETLSVQGPTGDPDLTELTLPGSDGRLHCFTAPPGTLTIHYEATVDRSASGAPVSAADRVEFRRPSRYAESDRMIAIARTEFAGIDDPATLLAYVASWVGTRLAYVPGSSQPTDGAVATLLRGAGVCRDFAHLVVALLRGLDVPARLVAVYAPGLDPMDFHAVAEAAIGDRWLVADATTLAPRSSLLRICSGRDAADTAFLTSYRGNVMLRDMAVSAVVDGPLPTDDPREPVRLG